VIPSQDKQNNEAFLVKKRHKELAIAFREQMTTGQSFQGTNSYRQNFFEDVISTATEVSCLSNLPSVTVMMNRL
jgi:hypothetical protein